MEQNQLEEITETPRECEYKPICPDNIPKFSMKCVFGINECNVKSYYDRYKQFEGHLGI